MYTTNYWYQLKSRHDLIFFIFQHFLSRKYKKNSLFFKILTFILKHFSNFLFNRPFSNADIFTFHSRCSIYKYGHLTFFKHIPSNTIILFYSQTSIIEYFIFFIVQIVERLFICSTSREPLHFNISSS